MTPIRGRGIVNEYLSLKSGIPVFDHGVYDPQGQTGYMMVGFNKTFPGAPHVIATQMSGTVGVQTQSITPPRISPHKIPPVTLASIQRTAPQPQARWGDEAKQYVVNACGNTIGRIPVIGGYLCSGIDSTFGELFRVALNAAQDIYYTFDTKALVASIADDVEAKVFTDWNNGLTAIQQSINSAIEDVNKSTESMTNVMQDSLNAVWPLIAEAHGLGNEAIPTVKVGGVNTSGFLVLSAGVPIHWIAIYGGS